MFYLKFICIDYRIFRNVEATFQVKRYIGGSFSPVQNMEIIIEDYHCIDLMTTYTIFLNEKNITKD